MKNLVYYSIGFNEKYNKLLELSLTTLKQHYNGDILIITDNNNLMLLKQNELYSDVSFMIVENIDSFNSAINRLKIYKYDRINEYGVALYLDVDTIIVNNLDSVFESTIDNNKIGVYLENRSIKDGKFLDKKSPNNFNNIRTDDIYGYFLFSDEELQKYENRKGINSGVLSIPINLKSLEILKSSYDQAIEEYYKRDVILLDQPYICYNLIVTNYYFSLKECHVTGNNGDFNDNIYKIDFEQKSIIHFVYNTKNINEKYENMLMFYNDDIINNKFIKTNMNINIKKNNYYNNKNIKLLSVTHSYSNESDYKESDLYKSFIKFNNSTDFINLHFNENEYVHKHNEYRKVYGKTFKYFFYNLEMIKSFIRTSEIDYFIVANNLDKCVCLDNINNINIKSDILFSSECDYKMSYHAVDNDIKKRYKIDYPKSNKLNLSFINSDLFIIKKERYLNLIDILLGTKKIFDNVNEIYAYHYIKNNIYDIYLDKNSELFFTSKHKDFFNYYNYMFPIFINDNGCGMDNSFIEIFNLDTF